MKKIVLSTILSVLMIAAMVSAAPGTPMPFVVIVDTFTPSDAVGMEVIVRDVTHPYTLVLTTNENHEAAGDWGNVPVQGFVGDEFEITVGSKVVKTVMKDSGLGDYGIVHVNLMDTTKDCPIDTTPYSLETCPTKEVIKEVPVTVEKIVEKTITVYQCANGTKQLEPCPEVSVSNPSYFYALLSAIFALLVAKYVPYGGKMRITRYLDAQKKQKMKIEKYEKYITASGNTSYHWKVVSDVFA